MEDTVDDFDMEYSGIIHRPRNSLTFSSEGTDESQDIPLTPPNGSSPSLDLCMTPEPKKLERNLFSRQRIRYHSTPLFMNRITNSLHNNQDSLQSNPDMRMMGPNKSYPFASKSNPDDIPIEYVNPFTPDGKMLANKVKAQHRLHNLSINPIGPKFELNDDAMDSEDKSLTKDESMTNDESLTDSDYELPSRPRLSELNVSRFNEEFIKLNEIGKGHHGCVFKCLNKMNGCFYAIKRTIKPVRSSLQERIIRNEIYAHGVLDHPNIVRNFSCWKEEEYVYIQNEFCNGGSLDSYIKKNRISESLLRSLLLQIACALRYIHKKGLAHMDVKPDNILLSIDPNNKTHNADSLEGLIDDKFDDIVFKLADLGHISKLDEKHDVEEGDCRYMPREILQEKYTCIDRADIFSLGLTVFDVAGGGPMPKNGEEWQDIRNGNLRNLEQYSEEFNKLLQTLTHPEADKRPSSAELVRILKPNYTSPSNEDMMGYFNQCRNNKAIFEHSVGTVEKYMLYVNNQVQKQIKEKVAVTAAKKRGAVTKTRLVGKKTARSASTTLF